MQSPANAGKDIVYGTRFAKAEEPLGENCSCLLSSINLSEFVIDPFTDHARFDYEGFSFAVEMITNEMNVVLDEGAYLLPLREQTEAALKWRQTGIGVMGFADMLVKMGVTYGSSRCLMLINKIGYIMANTAMSTSAHLASIDGPYPGLSEINDVTSTPYFQAIADEETKAMVKEYGLRNSQLLTIAPTGSTRLRLNSLNCWNTLRASGPQRRHETAKRDGLKTKRIGQSAAKPRTADRSTTILREYTASDWRWK